MNTSGAALVGAKWLTLGALFQKGVQALSLFFLVRLLTPSDFGLFAISILTMEVIHTAREMSLPAALLQRRTDQQDAASAVFWTSLGSSLLFYVLLFALAPFLASFFGHATIGPLLRLHGLNLFLVSAAIVQQTQAVRGLDLGRLAGLTLLESITTGIVSVVLAYAGLGVWAIVWGLLAGSAQSAALWWWLCPWRPATRMNWPVLKELFGTGLPLTAATALDALTDPLCKGGVGRFVGVASLGYFDLGMRVVNLPVRHLVRLLTQRVALPAFCQAQDDLPRLQSWFLSLIRYTSLLMAPFALCLLLTADSLIPALCGPQWAGLIPVVQFLAASAFALPFMQSNHVYIARGRTGALLKVTLVRVLIGVPAVIAAAMIGLQTACAVLTILMCLFAVVNLAVIARILEFRLMPILDQVVLLWREDLCFAAVLMASRHAVRALTGGGWAEAFPGILLGAIAYAGAIRLFHPETAREAVSLLKRALGLEKTGAHSR